MPLFVLAPNRGGGEKERRERKGVYAVPAFVKIPWILSMGLVGKHAAPVGVECRRDTLTGAIG